MGEFNVGAKTSIAFNTNYCLGFPAFVYAHIRGTVRDSMGVRIVVNGTTEAISRQDTEGWMGYENATTMINSSDCFIIQTITASGSEKVAWYRRL